MSGSGPPFRLCSMLSRNEGEILMCCLHEAHVGGPSEAVNFDALLLDQALLGQELGHVLTLIPLELDDFA